MYIMRTSSFTPSFFQPILTSDTPEPSREQAPLTYSHEKYGTVDNFIHSADFSTFKQEYTDVIDRITAFVHDHADRLTPPLSDEIRNQVKADFDVLKQHLFDLQTDYFGSHKPQVYGTGKEMLHEFDRLLKNDRIPLQQRMNAVIVLAPRTQVCSGGMLSELQEAITALKTTNRGLKGAAQQWKIKMMDDLILQHVETNHDYMPGDEIHYVNAYYNLLSGEMGVRARPDEYAEELLRAGELSLENLENCKRNVFAKLKPTRLAISLSDEYRGRLEESFSKNEIAPANIPFEKIKVLQVAQENELNPEYGPVSMHAFLAPIDPDDYDSPQLYTGARRPIGLTRHFLKELKKQELADYKHGKIVLGDSGEGRITMLDDLFWIKNKDGEPQEFTLRSLFKVSPEELLGNIEKAEPSDAQARTFLLRFIVQRVHDLLEAAGESEESGEALEKWLCGFAPAMEKRQPPTPGSSHPLILLATSFNKISALRNLLEAGCDKDAVGEDGKTALMLAAQGGHAEIVNVLLEAGADKEAVDNHKYTALMHAAHNGDIETVNALLEAVVDMEARDIDGHTALMHAAYSGNIEAMIALLKAGAEKDAGDATECTALMVAACSGEVEALKVLLEAGADKDARDTEGCTALMLAAYYGQTETLTALLKEGVDREARDKSNYSALMHAARREEVEIAKILIQHGANGVNELTEAASGDEKTAIETVSTLLQAGADGATALLKQALEGNTLAMECLIRAGADKVRDAQGKTALMRAVEMTAASGSDSGMALEALEALLDAGADTEITDNEGKTATVHAAELALSGGKDEAWRIFIKVAPSKSPCSSSSSSSSRSWYRGEAAGKLHN